MPDLPRAFLTQPLAHRGLHGANVPENTLAGIRAAMDAGYGIEIDIQPSADGVAMVFHDDRLDRMTTATGLIRDHDAGALTQLLLKDSGQSIPSLRDALRLVAGKAPLLIEVKDQSGMLGPVDGRLETAVAQALAGYRGDVAVMSFNPHSVHALGQLAPDVPRGLVTCGFAPADWPEVAPARLDHLRDIPDYAALGCSFISHDWRDLAAPAVARCKDAGAAILCWTIRNPDAEARARQHAANITFEGYHPTR